MANLVIGRDDVQGFSQAAINAIRQSQQNQFVESQQTRQFGFQSQLESQRNQWLRQRDVLLNKFKLNLLNDQQLHDFQRMDKQFNISEEAADNELKRRLKFERKTRQAGRHDAEIDRLLNVQFQEEDFERGLGQQEEAFGQQFGQQQQMEDAASDREIKQFIMETEGRLAAEDTAEMNKINQNIKAVEESDILNKNEKAEMLRQLRLKRRGIKDNAILRPPQFPDGQGFGDYWEDEKGNLLSRNQKGDLKVEFSAKEHELKLQQAVQKQKDGDFKIKESRRNTLFSAKMKLLEDPTSDDIAKLYSEIYGGSLVGDLEAEGINIVPPELLMQNPELRDAIFVGVFDNEYYFEFPDGRRVAVSI